MKCGYVAILGRPNAGKSSLINRIVGEQVAIVTRRRQTTRNNILGVFNDKDVQIIFIDTPGVHHSKNKLDKFMMKNVRSAIGSADVVVYLIDASTLVDEEELDYIKMLKSKVKNVIVVLNKVDKKLLAQIDADMKISAKEGVNIDVLLKKIEELLPIGEPIFSADEFTDRSVNFLVCEFIRGILLEKIDNEIPHGVAVVVDACAENEKNVVMDISIIVENERHKGFVIGKGGALVKELGVRAREYAEKLFGKPVVMHIFVKVDENWRDRNISSYGY